jgi:polygalacturonase
VWRNVKDYGAKGDNSTDDTAAINAAVQAGNRCGQACGSTSVLQAVVYFPEGTYVVSSSITQYFFTQFIGNVGSGWISSHLDTQR